MNEGKKQVVVIHGGEAWDTYEEYIEYLKNYEFTEDKFKKITSKRWKENLQDELGENFQVIKPSMPSERNAKYDEWVIWFEKLFPYLNESIILVGHSLGATFLAKYVSENVLPVSLDQLHLVAGAICTKGGFDFVKSLEKIEKQCKNIFIYHSTDDFVVDFSEGLKYKKMLPGAEFVQFEDRGHFLQEDFPEIIKNIKDPMVLQ